VGGNGHKWEDNIKMDLREIGFKRVDWINLAQNKDQCSFEHGNELSGSINDSEFLDYWILLQE
jgi:hypothetical protein